MDVLTVFRERLKASYHNMDGDDIPWELFHRLSS